MLIPDVKGAWGTVHSDCSTTVQTRVIREAPMRITGWSPDFLPTENWQKPPISQAGCETDLTGWWDQLGGHQSFSTPTFQILHSSLQSDRGVGDIESVYLLLWHFVWKTAINYDYRSFVRSGYVTQILCLHVTVPLSEWDFPTRSPKDQKYLHSPVPLALFSVAA